MAPVEPPRGPWADGTVDGTVVEFDDDRGYGTVADDDGDRWWFHCTSIADGSRTIAVGASVRFEVVPGHLGRFEAVAVRPTAGA
jgi:cold shock CspA family protein